MDALEAANLSTEGSSIKQENDEGNQSDSDTEDEEEYDPSVPPPEPSHIETLKTHFGHARFRP